MDEGRKEASLLKLPIQVRHAALAISSPTFFPNIQQVFPDASYSSDPPRVKLSKPVRYLNPRVISSSERRYAKTSPRLRKNLPWSIYRSLVFFVLLKRVLYVACMEVTDICALMFSYV